MTSTSPCATGTLLLAAITVATWRSPLHTAATSAGVIALTHVTLIDGTGRDAQRDMTILVRDRHVADVYSSSSRPVPAGATEMNLEGQYVIPGRKPSR